METYQPHNIKEIQDVVIFVPIFKVALQGKMDNHRIQNWALIRKPAFNRWPYGQAHGTLRCNFLGQSINGILIYYFYDIL